MLSNHQIPDTAPGRHQRQNSTPTVIESQDTAAYPATLRQHESHRRGFSLDHNPGLGHKAETPQQDNFTGLEELLRQQIGQHTLREAQQQQEKARPGLKQNYELTQHSILTQDVQHTPGQAPGLAYTTDNHSTHNTGLDTNTQSLNDRSTTNTMDFFRTFDSTNPAGYLDGFGTGPDGPFGNFQPNQIMHSSQLTHCLPMTEGRRESSDINIQTTPHTPVKQTNKNYLPLTPETTPFMHKATVQHGPHGRTVEPLPRRIDPNETIKASHAMQRGSSCQDSTPMKKRGMSPDIPSPPRTAPLLPRWALEVAPFPQPDNFNLSSLKLDFPGNGEYNPADYSPMTNGISSSISSFQSSPEIAHMQLFDNVNMDIDQVLMAAKLAQLPAFHGSHGEESSSSPAKRDPQAGSQSTSDMDLDECMEETGVTVDEIASFIMGPMPEDGKWQCLYEGCGKHFGRKENIKSHVQTHLGDRPYRCKECDTRFVRQHDLKRHMKIHSTNKPYKCPCSREFHRHDALTRHRQRGTCIGAFEGTPKKVIKRGRPKKPRPNPEDRQEKAAKTRKYVMERTLPGSTYASSISGSSEHSYPSPPEVFDNLSIGASSPSPSHKALPHSSYVSPAFLAHTPPASPPQSVSQAFSSQRSQHSHTPKAASQSSSPNITHTAEDLLDILPTHVGSRKSSVGHHSSVPELDISSSSPATSKFFDFDGKSDLGGNGPSSNDDKPNDIYSKDMFEQDFVLLNELTKDSNNSQFDPFFDNADAGQYDNNFFQPDHYGSFRSDIAVSPSDIFTNDYMIDAHDDVFAAF